MLMRTAVLRSVGTSLPQEPLKITMCRKYDALQACNVNGQQLDGSIRECYIAGNIRRSTHVYASGIALRNQLAISCMSPKEIGSKSEWMYASFW